MGKSECVESHLPIPNPTHRNSPIIQNLLQDHTVFFACTLTDRIHERRTHSRSNQNTNGTRDNAARRVSRTDLEPVAQLRPAHHPKKPAAYPKTR
jgi:hypothetical protein